jgi:hypothetical protein
MNFFAELKRRHIYRVAAAYAVAMCLIISLPALTAEKMPIPVFAPSPNVGWIADSNVFTPPPSGPGPVMSDSAYPRITNAEAAATGKPPSFPIADAGSPILQPWAKLAVRERNAVILSGKPGYPRSVSCWPMGVPGVLLNIVQPVYFVQTPKYVLLLWQMDRGIRHIYINVPHSANPRPSWFGESVGHYEGDSLVVDTVGLNNKSFVDDFRTPHTEKLHVVERFRMIDGGKTWEVNIRVEDPGAFTAPWYAMQRYRRIEDGPLVERVCAENPTNYFNLDMDPVPTAGKPDF